MILFVCAPTPPKMQGRDAMAWTIQCADGLEKATPLNMASLGIYVRFLECKYVEFHCIVVFR